MLCMWGRRLGILLLVGVSLLSFAGCSKEKKQDTAVQKESPETADITSEDLLPDQELAFSKPEYFYEADTEVKIISRKNCEIYYSMDGTEPDQKQTRYTEPIKLIANSDTKANCIKAKAFYEDGTESKTIVHTYFVGKNVKKRFDTLIFSISTDPYNLFDEEYGIFVEGKLREDFIKNNPGLKIDPDDPANYNIRGKEGERPVYVEVLEPEGALVVGQAAGIRTYGGWSRAREQKSIKIYARKEYDEQNNKLRYEFFPNRRSADGKVIDTYKQLVLRNCGNDNGFAFIRDELFQTLAGQAGYTDYQAVRPAAMFVNGEYRGFFWLHEVYCDEYFEDHYGDFNGSFELLEGGETFKKEEEDGSSSQFILDYNEMYEYADKDLTKDQTYQELCELMDVENYLSYYALNIYIGNEDWPHNNYKTYRYYAAEGEAYREAPFDGKWRYLLHDMDFSTGIYGTDALADNISKYVSMDGRKMEESPLFSQLMRREDCREIFIKKTLDLINGTFAPDYAFKVLDEMHASRLNEQQNMYDKGLLEYWVSYDQLDGRIGELKYYLTERARHIITKYQSYFELGSTYQLIVKPSADCQVKINSFTSPSDFEGSYYTDYDTILSAVLPEGKQFDYWLVGDDKVEEEQLILNASMVKQGKIKVELVVK